MRRLSNMLFLLYFLFLFCVIRILTRLLSLVRFNSRLGSLHKLRKGLRRVIYLEVFFPDNSGYQYRAQKWAEVLRRRGIRAEVKYVFEREDYERILANKRIVFFYTLSLLVRIWQCMTTVTSDCVIVRRELLQYNDYGNLFMEKFLLALHPQVILDFDDDIGADKRENRALTWYGRALFECPDKFSRSLELYQRFIAGSPYLSEIVRKKNGCVGEDNVAVIPTCVDYEQYPAKSYASKGEYLNFGWIGTTGNQYLLKIVLPALNEAAKRRKIRLVMISGEEYRADVDFEIVNLRWSYDREIENLRLIDIGLMPLYDEEVERGKCGFKLIQYMGLGIVSIASAVTVNNEIVNDNVNGFLVYRESDWPEVVAKVLANSARFSEIGAAARRKIYRQYSFTANTEKYLGFIKAHSLNDVRNYRGTQVRQFGD